MKTVFLFLLGITVGMAAPASKKPAEAFVLDWPKSPDYEEQFLVETLQGTANRDSSQLFVRMFYPGDPTSDDFWKKYLEKEKGYHFTRLGSIGEAVRHFAKTGTIQGLVVYPSGNEDLACIAVNVAAQRNLLPVSDRILACKTQWLSDQNHWVEDDFSLKDWTPTLVASLGFSEEGLKITCGEKSFKPVQLGAGAERWVQIGSDVRAVEIETPNGTAEWGLDACDMTGEYRWLVEPTKAHGTRRVEFPGNLHGPVRLRIRIMGEKDQSVTVRRIRLLDDQGQLAKASPPPATDIFKRLPIVEDLGNRFANTEQAWLWALDTSLPNATKKMAFSYDNIWQYSGMDLAVAHRAFVFRDDFSKNLSEPVPVYDRVSAHLDRPGAILGWAEPEWLYCSRASHDGHYVLCSIAPNISFFKHVAVDKPVVLPQPLATKTPLQKKHYVIFHVIDGDGLTNTIARYHSQNMLGWDSPQRGETPICWTIQPLLLEYAPSLLEYYAKTATPNDGFMCGASGAGYSYPSLMPNIPEFGQHTQKTLVQTNLHSLDIWDLFYYDLERSHRYLSGAAHRVRSYYPAPPSATAWKPMNQWLEDGTPVLSASTLPGMNLWGNYPEFLDWKNDPAADLASRILKVAETVEPPYFIIAHGKMFPDLVKKVAAQLPNDRFEILTMTDAERLATDAGRFTAHSNGTGVAPGQEITIQLAVRNPDGQSGSAGEVACDLPAGWKAIPATWKHGPVNTRTTLHQTLRIQIPADAGPGLQRLIFRKAGDTIPRTVPIAVYPESQTLFDGKQVKPWKTIGSGEILYKEGRTLAKGRSSADAVSLSTEIDFDRSPILEVFVPSTRSKWGLAVQDGKLEKKLLWGEALIGSQTYDLSAVTGWQGRRMLDLRFFPAISGPELELARVTVHYLK